MKGRLAGEQHEGAYPERVDVAGVGGLGALHQLGGEVGRGAEDAGLARGEQAGEEAALDHLARVAEVDQGEIPARAHDEVLELEIGMHQVLRVHVSDHFDQLEEGGNTVEGGALLEHHVQGIPGHEVHREARPSADLADPPRRRQGIVVQALEESELILEAGEVDLVLLLLRTHHLHRHRALVLLVGGAVDLGDAAGADLLAQQIGSEGGIDERIGHSCNPL